MNRWGEKEFFFLSFYRRRECPIRLSDQNGRSSCPFTRVYTVFTVFFPCQSVRGIASKTVRRVRPFCPVSQAAHSILGRIGCPACPDILPLHAVRAFRPGCLSMRNRTHPGRAHYPPKVSMLCVRTEWTRRIALLPRSDGVLEHIADLHPAGLLHQRVLQPPA